MTRTNTAKERTRFIKPDSDRAKMRRLVMELARKRSINHSRHMRDMRRENQRRAWESYGFRT